MLEKLRELALRYEDLQAQLAEHLLVLGAAAAGQHIGGIPDLSALLLQ